MKTIVVSDKMQQGYRYSLVEPVGKHFYPDFKPELTPKEIMELGIFGGVYMRDCTDEFPKDWFVSAQFAQGKRDKDINYFKINASQPLSVWREKGWIHR